MQVIWVRAARHMTEPGEAGPMDGEPMAACGSSVTPWREAIFDPPDVPGDRDEIDAEVTGYRATATRTGGHWTATAGVNGAAFGCRRPSGVVGVASGCDRPAPSTGNAPLLGGPVPASAGPPHVG